MNKSKRPNKKFFVFIEYRTRIKVFEFTENEKIKNIKDCKKYIEKNYKLNVPLSEVRFEYRKTIACPNCDQSCIKTKLRKQIRFSNGIVVYFPCSTANFSYWIDISSAESCCEELRDLLKEKEDVLRSIPSLTETTNVLMYLIKKKPNLFSPEDKLVIVALQKYCS